MPFFKVIKEHSLVIEAKDYSDAKDKADLIPLGQWDYERFVKRAEDWESSKKQE
jgi:hypothetical protein